MKTKKLSVALIFFAITLVAYAVASVLGCYTTKPEVTTGAFPFSITYEYKGETKTLSGVLECEFYGSNTVDGEHVRYWDEETKYDNPLNPEYPEIVDENEELQTMLSVQPYMSAGYLMGDPLYADYAEEYGDKGAEPYIQYYDYKNDISLNEENKDEILESIGFKIIDFTYAEPIENSFSFSGIQYESDHVILFAAISFVFLLLCLIFVRKDKEYAYSNLDKIGILFNFLVGCVALPFITIVCILFGIAESNVHLINQTVYAIPSIFILCLAWSIVFRRKGLSRTGFFMQFGGILPFVLVLVLEAVI